MPQLVIGNKGEVGSALQKILKCDGIDIDEHKDKLYKVLHIAFPYTSQFVEYVKLYINAYEPELVIIHSTVPIGTTRKCGDICVHSPIRGIHPHLEEGIKVFIKFFGGQKAVKAANIFRKLGIECITTKNPQNTEAGKLWSTTAYGLSIILEKEIYKYCKKRNLDFNVVYTQFTETYNEGYLALGKAEVMRPILKHMEGKIGGHCLISNAKLLKGKIANFILNGK